MFLKQFKTYQQDNKFIIEQHMEGDFDPSYNSYIITLKGIPNKIKTVWVDDMEKSSEVIKRDKMLMLTVPKKFNKIIVE